MPPAPTAAERESLDRLLQQRRWKAARGMLEKFRSKYPDDSQTAQVLAAFFQNPAVRCHSEAEAECRRGLALAPNDPDLIQKLVHSLIYQARFPEARTLLQNATVTPDSTEWLRSRMLLACADPDTTPDDYRRTLQECGQRFTARFKPNPCPVSPLDPQRHRRRIGYYSDEFYIVQMMYFLYPLLFHHNRNDFEIYLYSSSPVSDAMTDLYRPCADHWVDLSTLSRTERTARIAADDLDILVAASGNSFHEDYAFLLDHPARIQLGWWISSGRSSGLGCFDALLIDKVSAPPGSDAMFTERLWRLDGNATPFYPTSKMEAVSPSPAQRNGYVTFCSTTRMFRLNPGVIAVWAAILHRIPGSRLTIDSLELDDAGCCASLRQQFANHGITADRLDLGHFNQWETFRTSDITLDAFPFSAGTSPCQAMYLGHPVVTLAGQPSHGRLAASHVTWAGYPEWVAQSQEDYISKAVDLGQNTVKLAEIRQNLRTDLEASPLMDYADFARRLTAAYQSMLEQYQRGDWHSRS